MTTVVFVAPFFLDTTVRFLASAAGLPGVRLALLSQDPVDRLPADIRARLVGHVRLHDGLDAQQIADGVRALARGTGGRVDRLVGALEQLQVQLAEVRELLRIPGMGVETAHNFRDKARMKSVLREHGVPCARHRLAAGREDALAFVREVGFPVVAKPPAGAGGKETHRIDRPEQLEQLFGFAPPAPERPVLFEEFVLGEEHSFDAVTIHGRPVWHSLSRYFPAPLEVLENPWIQWCVVVPREVEDPRYDDIRDVAARAVHALGMRTGLTHMEWFRRRDGSIAVSEVGARPPGAQFTTLMSYANDFDLYRAWARLMIFDAFDPPERKFAAGAAYLRGQGQGHVKAIHGLDVAQREIGPLVVEVRLPEAGQPSSGSYEGEGYVIVKHPDTEVVFRALRRLIEVVRVEMG